MRSAIAVFVWRNAFGRTRNRSPQSSSSIASAPCRSCVGRFVTSAGRSLTDQWIDRTSGKRSSAATKLSTSSMPGSRDELDERLTGVSPLADDEVAQEAGVLGLVVRLEALRAGPVAHRLPDRVPEVGREPALADVQHLVPAAGPVEAERGAVRCRRERVLELVPVVERRLGRDDRLERRVVDSADPAERLLDLRRLRLELRLVREVLEPAASAGRVVLARRVDPRRSRLDDLERERFRVVALHPGHARADDVAGQPAADEDDEAVQSRNAVPAVRERLDPEVELVVRSNGRGHATSIGF